jgi:hypothetical protein
MLTLRRFYCNNTLNLIVRSYSLSRMNTRTLRLMLFFLLAALSVFSLSTITQRSVAADEFSMAWTCKQDPTLITGLYLSPRENNPPGCALAMHYWGAVFGYSDVALRLFSTLFCVVSLGALWLMTRELTMQRQHQAPEHIAEHTHLTAFLLASTTPVLWMSANFARYQSLSMLLAFLAVWAYLRWLREWKTLHLALFALCTALLFYVHYLPAATLAVSAGLHFVVTYPMRSRCTWKQLGYWSVAQFIILLIIAPLVYWIALAYVTIDLSAGRSNQLAAAPKFVAALLYGAMDGFVIPFWWLWVFVPSVAVFVMLAWRSLKRDLLFSPLGIWFALVPFVFAAVVMAKMYPAEMVFLTPAIQKIAYLAPLLWVFLGLAASNIKQTWLRNAVIACAVLCNIYAIAVWNLNITAVQHTPPLREIAATVRSAGDAKNAVVVHSFLYFYGPLGMGKQAGAVTAVQHTIPEAASLVLPETDVAPALTLDSLRSLVRTNSTKRQVWIVQRNRFPQNAQMLASALEHEGFRRVSETLLQPQSAFDMWFKAQLLERGVVGSADTKETPQPYLYTLQGFMRRGAAFGNEQQ